MVSWPSQHDVTGGSTPQHRRTDHNSPPLLIFKAPARGSRSLSLVQSDVQSRAGQSKAEYRPWTQTCGTDRVFMVSGPSHNVVTGVAAPQYLSTDHISPPLLVFKASARGRWYRRTEHKAVPVNQRQTIVHGPSHTALLGYMWSLGSTSM